MSVNKIERTIIASEDEVASLIQDAVYQAMNHFYQSQTQSKSKEVDDEKDDITDVKGIALYTKYSVSSIYKYVTTRNLPFFRPSGRSRRIFFSKKEVNAWIKGNYCPTNEAIAAQARSIKINSKNK
jgi:predicted DNA-binding transcriptional regulator AlpA